MRQEQGRSCFIGHDFSFVSMTKRAIVSGGSLAGRRINQLSSWLSWLLVSRPSLPGQAHALQKSVHICRLRSTDKSGSAGDGGLQRADKLRSHLGQLCALGRRLWTRGRCVHASGTCQHMPAHASSHLQSQSQKSPRAGLVLADTLINAGDPVCLPHDLLLGISIGLPIIQNAFWLFQKQEEPRSCEP